MTIMSTSSSKNEDLFQNPTLHYYVFDDAIAEHKHTWSNQGFRKGSYHKHSSGSSSVLVSAFELVKKTKDAAIQEDGSVLCCLWYIPTANLAKSAYHLFFEFERKVGSNLASKYILKPEFQDDEKLPVVVGYPYFQDSFNDWARKLVDSATAKRTWTDKDITRIRCMMRRLIKIGFEMVKRDIKLAEGKFFDSYITVINDEPKLLYCDIEGSSAREIFMKPFIIVLEQILYGSPIIDAHKDDYLETKKRLFTLDKHVEDSIERLKCAVKQLTFSHNDIEREARIWDSTFYTPFEKKKVIRNVHGWFHGKWTEQGANCIDSKLKFSTVFSKYESKPHGYCYKAVYVYKSRAGDSAIEFARDCLEHFLENLNVVHRAGDDLLSEDDVAELMDKDFNLINIIREAVLNITSLDDSPCPGELSNQRWKNDEKQRLWSIFSLSGVPQHKE